MSTPCAYRNCINGRWNITMFRFPVHDEDRLSMWIRNSGNTHLSSLTSRELSRQYICAAHFPPSDICCGPLRTTLSGKAVPLHFNSTKVGDRTSAKAHVDMQMDLQPSSEASFIENSTPFCRSILKMSSTEQTRMQENMSKASPSDIILPINVQEIKQEFPRTDQDMNNEDNNAANVSSLEVYIDIEPIQNIKEEKVNDESFSFKECNEDQTTIIGNIKIENSENVEASRLDYVNGVIEDRSIDEDNDVPSSAEVSVIKTATRQPKLELSPSPSEFFEQMNLRQIKHEFPRINDTLSVPAGVTNISKVSQQNIKVEKIKDEPVPYKDRTINIYNLKCEVVDDVNDERLIDEEDNICREGRKDISDKIDVKEIKLDAVDATKGVHHPISKSKRMEIITLHQQNLSNREIARRLGVTTMADKDPQPGPSAAEDQPRPGSSAAANNSQPGPSSPVVLVPGWPVITTPRGRGRTLAEGAYLYEKSSSGILRACRKLGRGASTTPHSRRSLRLDEIVRALHDSDIGEDDDYEEDEDEDSETDLGSLLSVNNYSYARSLTRAMRDHIVTNDEITYVDERVQRSDMERVDVCGNVERVEETDVEINREDIGAQDADHVPDTSYNWSANFSEFTGQKETYVKDPGPQFSSQDPLDIFLHIWDENIVNLIVRETNEYAWRYIAHLSDPDFDVRMPEHLRTWREMTVVEVYRLLSVMMYMSTCPRTNLKEFWKNWRMEMPGFRRIMSRNRYYQLCRFLHFVDNDADTSSLSDYQRKIHKISPILEHCNDKFSSMYVPSQYLSLDESLLQWKGRLSWKQCIRSKAARFGIKSFELCEATTGYLLRCILYGGKDSSMVQGSLRGFSNATAKVVLKLMEGYLNVGHVLVLNNWYNQIELTRYLKQHHTDVIGTMNRRRHNVPDAIKHISADVPRGTVVARHCGDISLTAWKDVKLVTVVSTYHSNEMVAGSRGGQSVRKPVAISEYNAYMGVDLKDQKLSMFLFERKRGSKWYMKVFRRLVNTSLLNAYILYLRNPCFRVMSHWEFRKLCG